MFKERNLRAPLAAITLAASTIFSGSTPPIEAQHSQNAGALNAASRIEQAIDDRDLDFLLSVLSADFPSSSSALNIDNSVLLQNSIDGKPSCLRYQDDAKDATEAQLLFSNFPEKGSVGFLVLKKDPQGWKISDVRRISEKEWSDPFFRSGLDVWDACPNPSKDAYVFGRVPHIEQPPIGHKVFPEPRMRYLFTPGMTTSISSGGAGFETSHLFLDFQTTSHDLHNMRGEDILNMSWGGWKIDSENGLFYPLEQSCVDTLRDPKRRAAEMVEFYKQWFAYHPNDRLKVLTHSEGVQPALFSMEMVKELETKDPNYPVNPGQIDFIFTHDPALGINRGTILEVGAKFINQIPQGCIIPFTSIPVLAVLNQPAGKNLIEMWDRRVGRGREILEVVNWWRASGSTVAYVGNYQDEALYSNGWMSEGVLRLLLKINTQNQTVFTQRVPGAMGDIYYLGHNDHGHTPAWTTSQGRQKVAKEVWRRG